MVFLNGNKTSRFVKLLLHIQVTCSTLLLQMQRDKPCAEGQGSRGEQSAVRRWVGAWCQREDASGGYTTNLEVWLFFFYFEGVKQDIGMGANLGKVSND